MTINKSITSTHISHNLPKKLDIIFFELSAYKPMKCHLLELLYSIYIAIYKKWYRICSLFETCFLQTDSDVFYHISKTDVIVWFLRRHIFVILTQDMLLFMSFHNLFVLTKVYSWVLVIFTYTQRYSGLFDMISYFLSSLALSVCISSCLLIPFPFCLSFFKTLSYTFHLYPYIRFILHFVDALSHIY